MLCNGQMKSKIVHRPHLSAVAKMCAHVCRNTIHTYVHMYIAKQLYIHDPISMDKLTRPNAHSGVNKTVVRPQWAAQVGGSMGLRLRQRQRTCCCSSTFIGMPIPHRTRTPLCCSGNSTHFQCSFPCLCAAVFLEFAKRKSDEARRLFLTPIAPQKDELCSLRFSIKI